VSKLGEYLAWQLNHAFPTLAIHRSLEGAKRNVAANQQWAYEEARRIVPAFEPYWDLRGKHILDIGTGLGGKLPFYVEAGAKAVTGIDINAQSLCTAHNHIIAHGLSSALRLVRCDAAQLPFPNNSFDAIVSINVFEHIERVECAVQEAYRVLEPGGIAFLHLPPYFSAWGAHLENWIHFPWPHLLFSERTLMRVAAREDARQHLSRQFVEAARIDWQASRDRIPDVNHVTLHHFRQMVRRAGFTILQLRVLPIGYDFLKSADSAPKRFTRWVLNSATHTPLLREVIITKMVYILQKTQPL
jgi:ubiquinone/menaquinone biosynthesis C-methylase UbiE